MLLCARWIVPLSSPPLEDAALLIEEDRIKDIGPRKKFSQEGPLLDLGNAILLPGLINTHTHLDSTPMPSLDRQPSFTEWVREMGKPSHQRRAQHHGGAQSAAPLLIGGGTTTMAGHCHPDTELLSTPLRRIIFWEVLGAEFDRARQSLLKAQARTKQEGGFVSPHSLYGVHPEVLKEMFSKGTHGRLQQSIHLLESEDENEFFRKKSGALADYVLERGGQLDRTSPSPLVGLLNSVGAAGAQPAAPLLVHMNYVTEAEMDILQKYDLTVVHCPGSHMFFGHRKFPLEELRSRKIRIALGTDSLSSNTGLSMFREMRLLQENYPFLSAKEIITLATREGARALNMSSEVGSLEIGKKADVIAVPLLDSSKDPCENILMAEEVMFSMINGRIVWGSNV